MAWLGLAWAGFFSKRALDDVFSQFFVVVVIVVVVGHAAVDAEDVVAVVIVVFSLPEAGAGVFLAVGPAALRIETLSFQINSADSTIEAFRMPVLPEGLDPAVRRLDGESASVTFGGEQLFPGLFRIHFAILNVKAFASNWRLVVEANEALGMKRLAHGIHAIVLDGLATLGASGCEVFLVFGLAKELASFLDEADVLKGNSGVGADEGVGRERLAESQDERTSDLFASDGAYGDLAGEDGLLDFGTSSSSERRLSGSFGNRRHFRRSGDLWRRSGRRSGSWSRSGSGLGVLFRGRCGSSIGGSICPL